MNTTLRKSCMPMLCMTLLAACSFEPTYQRPAPPVAATYPGAGGAPHQQGAMLSAHGADIGWRDFFTDPRLQALIALALQNNRDLRIAMLNVEDMRAKYQIQRSTMFPTVDALANSATQHQPPALRYPGEPTTIYSVGVGVTSFELDFFGRVRSLRDQALQQYLATQAAQTSAQITLVSEVASVYLTWEANQELLQLAEQTLKNQQSGYDMMNRRVMGRASSQLDLQRAQTQVEQAAAAVDQYKRQLGQSENELTLLIGEPIPADLPPPRPLAAQGVLEDLPAGLPSDLLERRPDIIAAEDQLKAANASIGAARAAFFPRIALTGTFGVQSASLGSLFSSGVAWGFSPTVTLPIFDGGSTKGNYDSAKVEKNIYVAQYEKSIQTAFREVSDGLVGRTTLASQLKNQQELVDTTAKTYDLSMMRFRAGMGDYFDALDSQRSLFAGQQTLVEIRLAQLTNMVTLYKALGGGWSETTRQASDVPQSGQHAVSGAPGAQSQLNGAKTANRANAPAASAISGSANAMGAQTMRPGQNSASAATGSNAAPTTRAVATTNAAPATNAAATTNAVPATNAAATTNAAPATNAAATTNAVPAINAAATANAAPTMSATASTSVARTTNVTTTTSAPRASHMWSSTSTPDEPSSPTTSNMWSASSSGNASGSVSQPAPQPAN